MRAHACAITARQRSMMTRMSTSFVPQIELLGNYALNEEIGYIENGQRSEGLRVLKKLPPSFDFDLLDGYTGDCFQESFQIWNTIGNIVTWMVKYHALISSNESGDKPFDVDFVCQNGVLKKILDFSFDRKAEKYEFAVSKYKGILFIKRISKEEDEYVHRNRKESSYAGCKFEKIISEKLNPEDESQKYYNVMKAKFGDHVLLYSCEVDCIKERLERDPELGDFVEIKTAAAIRDKYTGSFTDDFKKIISRRWWTQCTMAGITQITVGIKDQSPGGGYIHCKKVENVSVSNLKRNAIDWSSKQAFQMLNKFLKKIKEIVTTQDNPDIIYLFSVERGKEILHEKLISHSHEKFLVVTKIMIEKLDEIN